MTKPELLQQLARLQAADPDQCEATHIEADELLLAYIADADITAAYEAISKWYA